MFPFSRIPDCVAIRPPLYHPDVPYVVFWSQKAGCTTAVKWFLAQCGLLEEALAYSRWVHDYEAHVFRKRPHYRRGVVRALCDGHPAVKVVRDPMRRAPSAFLVLAEPGALRSRGENWTRRHWRRIDAWLAARGRPPGAISFVDHLAMVAELERRRAHTVDQHLSQQFVRGETRFLSEVVPIETFPAWAAAKAGEPGVAPVDMGRVLGSRHHHVADPERTAALGDRPEEVPLRRGQYADRRFPAASAYVNPRTEPLIRAAYAADFAAYGPLYGHGR